MALRHCVKVLLVMLDLVADGEKKQCYEIRLNRLKDDLPETTSLDHSALKKVLENCIKDVDVGERKDGEIFSENPLPLLLEILTAQQHLLTQRTSWQERRQHQFHEAFFQELSLIRQTAALDQASPLCTICCSQNDLTNALAKDLFLTINTLAYVGFNVVVKNNAQAIQVSLSNRSNPDRVVLIEDLSIFNTEKITADFYQTIAKPILDLVKTFFTTSGISFSVAAFNQLQEQINARIETIDKHYAPMASFNQSLRTAFQREGKIRRLFYEQALPLSDHYIHLAIASKKDFQSAQEKLKIKDHSALNAMYAEANKTEQDKSLSTLLPRNQNHAIKKNKRFITGIAGVGKTTAGKYMAYQWALEKNASKANSDYDHWRTQYSAIVWVPLRYWLTEEYTKNPNVTLADIALGVINHVKSSHENLLPSAPSADADINILSLKKEAEKKAQFVEELERDSRTGRILWILDGYDEVDSKLAPHMNTCLKTILKFPHVFVVSRPYYLNAFQSEYKFHPQAEHEVIGFIDKNIREYIESFFTHLRPPEPSKGNTLLDFLKKSPGLWGTCRVPIILELICSIWEKQSFREQQLTVTQLYIKVIAGLCRRYLAKAKSKSTAYLNDDSVLNECQNVLDFMSFWAFDSLSKDEVVSSLSTAFRAFSHMGEEQEKVIKDLFEAGFFRAITDGGFEAEKSYYFPHRTFQEYFAARYVSAQLAKQAEVNVKGEAMAAIEYIKRYCNREDFQMLGWFIAGFLSDKPAYHNLRETYFKALFTLADMAIGYQSQLLLRCWDETWTHATTVIAKFSEDLQHTMPSLIENGLRLSLTMVDNAEAIAFIRQMRLSPFVFHSDVVERFFRETLASNDPERCVRAAYLLYRIELPLSYQLADHFISKCVYQPALLWVLLHLIPKMPIADERSKLYHRLSMQSWMVEPLQVFVKAKPHWFKVQQIKQDLPWVPHIKNYLTAESKSKKAFAVLFASLLIEQATEDNTEEPNAAHHNQTIDLLTVWQHQFQNTSISKLGQMLNAYGCFRQQWQRGSSLNPYPDMITSFWHCALDWLQTSLKGGNALSESDLQTVLVYLDEDIATGRIKETMPAPKADWINTLLTLLESQHCTAERAEWLQRILLGFLTSDWQPEQRTRLLALIATPASYPQRRAAIEILLNTALDAKTKNEDVVSLVQSGLEPVCFDSTLSVPLRLRIFLWIAYAHIHELEAYLDRFQQHIDDENKEAVNFYQAAKKLFVPSLPDRGALEDSIATVIAAVNEQNKNQSSKSADRLFYLKKEISPACGGVRAPGFPKGRAQAPLGSPSARVSRAGEILSVKKLGRLRPSFL